MVLPSTSGTSHPILVETPPVVTTRDVSGHHRTGPWATHHTLPAFLLENEAPGPTVPFGSSAAEDTGAAHSFRKGDGKSVKHTGLFFLLPFSSRRERGSKRVNLQNELVCLSGSGRHCTEYRDTGVLPHPTYNRPQVTIPYAFSRNGNESSR